jgi:hypothetical protein
VTAGRTTLVKEMVEAIRLGQVRKEQILGALHKVSFGIEQLRKGLPAIRVTFQTLVSPGFADGTAVDNEPLYETCGELDMYELTDVSRVDVLRFGRYDNLDVSFDDIVVSREHGLVIFAGGYPLYCDFGTLDNGERHGSRNGTYVDGLEKIRDAMIMWMPGQTLSFGGKLGGIRRNRIAYQMLRDPN